MNYSTEALKLEKEEELTLNWNETCSDCRYYDHGSGKCDKSGAEVSPDRSKCPSFASA